MSERVEIHSSNGCPFGWRVRLAARVKNVAFDFFPYDVAEPDPRSKEHNPERKSPLLRDDDFVLTDSNVIGTYLDEAFEGPPLMPPTPRKRAWARLAMVELSPLQIPGYRDPTPETIARLDVALAALDRHLPLVEPWLTGSRPGLLDFQVWTGLSMVVRKGLAISPAAWAYLERARAHEAFAPTAPGWAR